MALENETLRIPKWFLQVFVALTASSVVGAFMWCVWVSATLTRWTDIIENIPRRLAIVEDVQRLHTSEIRKLKKVRLLSPKYDKK